MGAGVEKMVRRTKTGLEEAVGSFSAPDSLDKIEALAHMDPLSVGLLTGRLVAQERTIETSKFTATVRGFARRP